MLKIFYISLILSTCQSLAVVSNAQQDLAIKPIVYKQHSNQYLSANIPQTATTHAETQNYQTIQPQYPTTSVQNSSPSNYNGPSHQYLPSSSKEEVTTTPRSYRPLIQQNVNHQYKPSFEQNSPISNFNQLYHQYSPKEEVTTTPRSYIPSTQQHTNNQYQESFQQNSPAHNFNGASIQYSPSLPKQEVVSTPISHTSPQNGLNQYQPQNTLTSNYNRPSYHQSPTLQNEVSTTPRSNTPTTSNPNYNEPSNHYLPATTKLPQTTTRPDLLQTQNFENLNNFPSNHKTHWTPIPDHNSQQSSSNHIPPNIQPPIELHHGYRYIEPALKVNSSNFLTINGVIYNELGLGQNDTNTTQKPQSFMSQNPGLSKTESHTHQGYVYGNAQYTPHFPNTTVLIPVETLMGSYNYNPPNQNSIETQNPQQQKKESQKQNNNFNQQNLNQQNEESQIASNSQKYLTQTSQYQNNRFDSQNQNHQQNEKPQIASNSQEYPAQGSQYQNNRFGTQNVQQQLGQQQLGLHQELGQHQLGQHELEQHQELGQQKLGQQQLGQQKLGQQQTDQQRLRQQQLGHKQLGQQQLGQQQLGHQQMGQQQLGQQQIGQQQLGQQQVGQQQLLQQQLGQQQLGQQQLGQQQLAHQQLGHEHLGQQQQESHIPPASQPSYSSQFQSNKIGSANDNGNQHQQIDQNWKQQPIKSSQQSLTLQSQKFQNSGTQTPSASRPEYFPTSPHSGAITQNLQNFQIAHKLPLPNIRPTDNTNSRPSFQSGISSNEVNLISNSNNIASPQIAPERYVTEITQQMATQIYPNIYGTIPTTTSNPYYSTSSQQNSLHGSPGRPSNSESSNRQPQSAGAFNNGPSNNIQNHHFINQQNLNRPFVINSNQNSEAISQFRPTISELADRKPQTSSNSNKITNFQTQPNHFETPSTSNYPTFNKNFQSTDGNNYYSTNSQQGSNVPQITTSVGIRPQSTVSSYIEQNSKIQDQQSLFQSNKHQTSLGSITNTQTNPQQANRNPQFLNSPESNQFYPAYLQQQQANRNHPQFPLEKPNQYFTPDPQTNRTPEPNQYFSYYPKPKPDKPSTNPSSNGQTQSNQYYYTKPQHVTNIAQITTSHTPAHIQQSFRPSESKVQPESHRFFPDSPQPPKQSSYPSKQIDPNNIFQSSNLPSTQTESLISFISTPNLTPQPSGPLLSNSNPPQSSTLSETPRYTPEKQQLSQNIFQNQQSFLAKPAQTHQVSSANTVGNFFGQAGPVSATASVPANSSVNLTPPTSEGRPTNYLQMQSHSFEIPYYNNMMAPNKFFQQNSVITPQHSPKPLVFGQTPVTALIEPARLPHPLYGTPNREASNIYLPPSNVMQPPYYKK